VVAEAIADFFADKHNEDVLDAPLEHVTPLPMEVIASASNDTLTPMAVARGELICRPR
jgi:hypothetical protein